MKRFLFFLCLLLNMAFVRAQYVNSVKVTSLRSDNGEVTFWAENTSYAPHTVTISFSKLTNTTSAMEGETKEFLVEHGKEQLFILRPAVPRQGIGYSFRSLARKGNLSARVDTDYVYLLPMVVGKPVRPNRMVSMESFLKQPVKSQRVTGFSFRTSEGDTIVAARGGLVTEVEDQSASTTENKSFNATENYVEIYHKDGSFARYKLFKNKGVFVFPGDVVIPGQPIGIIGGSNYKGGSHLRFTTYSPSLENYSFAPSFYLGEGKTGQPEKNALYVSEHPQEIIIQEMSKKEKKKYLSNK